MKKLLIYIVVLAIAMLVPTEKSDVGRLIPVEVILLDEEKGQVILETDTGNMGNGKSVSEAIEDLKDTAAGLIYLDTAEYLLIRNDTAALIPEIRGYLKPGTRVCAAVGEIDLEMAAQYLAVHQPSWKLRDLPDEWKPEVLTEVNNSLKLKKIEN